MSVKARMKSRWTWTHDIRDSNSLRSHSSPSARTTAEWLKRCAVRGVSHFGQTPKTGCHHTTVMSCFLKVATEIFRCYDFSSCVVWFGLLTLDYIAGSRGECCATPGASCSCWLGRRGWQRLEGHHAQNER